MDAKWNALQTRIVESRAIMNNLYAQEALRDAVALERMNAKAEVVAKLVDRTRRSAA